MKDFEPNWEALEETYFEPMEDKIDRENDFVFEKQFVDSTRFLIPKGKLSLDSYLNNCLYYINKIKSLDDSEPDFEVTKLINKIESEIKDLRLDIDLRIEYKLIKQSENKDDIFKYIEYQHLERLNDVSLIFPKDRNSQNSYYLSHIEDENNNNLNGKFKLRFGIIEEDGDMNHREIYLNPIYGKGTFKDVDLSNIIINNLIYHNPDLKHIYENKILPNNLIFNNLNSLEMKKTTDSSQTNALVEKFSKDHPDKREILEQVLNAVSQENVSRVAIDFLKLGDTQYKALPALASKIFDNTYKLFDKIVALNNQETDGGTVYLMNQIMSNNYAAAIVASKGLQSEFKDVRNIASKLITKHRDYLQTQIDNPEKAEYKDKNQASLEAFDKYVFETYHNKENAILFKAVNPEMTFVDKYLSEKQIKRLEALNNGISFGSNAKNFNDYSIDNIEAIANGKRSTLTKDAEDNEMKIKVSIKQDDSVVVEKLLKYEELKIPDVFVGVNMTDDIKKALMEGKTIQVSSEKFTGIMSIDNELNSIALMNQGFADKIIPDKIMGVPLTADQRVELLKGNEIELDGLKSSQDDKTFKANIRLNVVAEKLDIKGTSEQTKTEEKKNEVMNDVSQNQSPKRNGLRK